VPGAGNPQAFNRYSFVLGNPLRYTDSTGHGHEPPKWAKDLIYVVTVIYTEIVQEAYKVNAPSGLPDKLIDNYVDRKGDMHLTSSEMMETNPIIDTHFPLGLKGV
jgi:hypothetical protein